MLEKLRTRRIEVWTDGSSHARGGKPGGWGYVIVVDGNPVDGAYGGDPSTSNNRMELTGGIKGLEAASKLIYEYPGYQIVLKSDSQYMLGMASGAFNPSKNLDLALRIRELAIELDAKTEWVKGHSGHVFNEIADKLAKSGKEEAIAGLSRDS